MGKRLEIVVTVMLALIVLAVLSNYWMVQWKRGEALKVSQRADDDCAANPSMGCSYYHDKQLGTHCWIFRETEYNSAEAFCMSDDEYDAFKNRKIQRYIQIQRGE
jgi:hypothetical protein